MRATTLHRKMVNGQLYPKAARTGPYAYAQEFTRVNGKVVVKYLGIVRVSEDVKGAEAGSRLNRAVVIEKGGEQSADQPSEPEPLQP